MYIKKMFTVTESTPPIAEVPYLVLREGPQTIKAVGLANGTEHELSANINEVERITHSTGIFAVRGFMTESDSQVTTPLLGIINLDDDNKTAMFLSL